jgi:hypothetical protein
MLSFLKIPKGTRNGSTSTSHGFSGRLMKSHVNIDLQNRILYVDIMIKGSLGVEVLNIRTNVYLVNDCLNYLMFYFYKILI